MGKLIFKYGTMNSGKSAQLLITAHELETRGKKVVLIKPNVGDGDEISSRVLGNRKVHILLEPAHCDDRSFINGCYFLVDEAQFLTHVNIKLLRNLAIKSTVICYGLRTDYKQQLFEGSKRLFEVADVLEEIKTSCISCDNKATTTMKFMIDETGNEVAVCDGTNDFDVEKSLDVKSSDVNEKYKPMCWECHMNYIRPFVYKR